MANRNAWRLGGVLLLGLGLARVEAQDLTSGVERAGDMLDIVQITKKGRPDALDKKKAIALGLDPSTIELPELVGHASLRVPESVQRRGKFVEAKVDCVLAAGGTLRNCQVVKSGGAEFDDAALDALSTFRYRPLRIAGSPRPVMYHLTMSFRVTSMPQLPLMPVQ